MRLANIFNLGVKELRSLRRDSVMIVLIIYSFSSCGDYGRRCHAGNSSQRAHRHRGRGSFESCPAALWTPSYPPLFQRLRH